ncbi:MAG: DUF1573 domain-containing protein [Phycisphaerales bacterium]
MKQWLLILLGAALLVGGPLFFAVRSAKRDLVPLSGVRTHDFGTVGFKAPKSEFIHQFQLRNDSGRSIDVLNVASSCGCTVATVHPRRIAPGESVAINATLTFIQPGVRQETIWLDIGARSPVALKLTAAARNVSNFFAYQTAVDLVRRDSAEIEVVVVGFDGDMPGSLTFAAPAGLSCNTGPWRMIHPPDPTTEQPARWQCSVEMSKHPSTDVPDDGRAELSIEGVESKITINLAGEPW